MVDSISFILNNEQVSTHVYPSTTLLNFIRKDKKLTGTKLVCREGDCGACTVLAGELVNDKVIYKTVTSCIYPMGKAAGKHIVTIEGLNKQELTVPQHEFVEEGATQCGFCTPGFIISLTWYLITHKNYSVDDAINGLGGNICRCTGYASIIRAVEKTVNKLKDPVCTQGVQVKNLIELNILPQYFSSIHAGLKSLNMKTAYSSKSNGENILVGGGTDLYVQKYRTVTSYRINLIDSKSLNYIKVEKKDIILGASVTFEQFKQSEILKKYLPRLENQMNLIASLPIRNSATIAGNIVNASPIADLTIILLALDATLVLTDSSNERIIKLKNFYKGYKLLDKLENEFIKEVRFPVPSSNFNFNFEKVSKRMYLDIASVNTAIFLDVENGNVASAKISAGGVAPIPLFLEKTSKYLQDKALSIETLGSALEIAQSEISPISDVRGSAEYKRLLLNQLIKAHFISLFPQEINIGELV
ncbi:putative xanthine dehydrogenase subunit E [bacterium BMS3Abin04]|nr:putative xanthine dehydrogenase subunit E [bacterium BMS3Abin04]